MKNKVHVVMLGPSVNVKGGISFVVREYLEAGLAGLVDLRVIPTYEEGRAARKIAAFLKSLWLYMATLFKPGPAVVHLHVSQKGSFVRKFVLFLMAKVFDKKTIVHLHGSEFEKFMNSNRLTRRLTKFMFDHSDVVLVLSNLWNEKLRVISSSKKITTLYNPIQLREMKRGSEKGVQILFLGRLGERKGIFDLLTCVAHRADKFRALKARFILAGDGEVEKARAFSAQYKLDDLVTIPGWISGDIKTDYLDASDILVLPSYYEQMPMSILEAMGYGYPVVATDVAGIPEMIENGENGFLFKPGDVSAMGRHLLELAGNEELRRSMGFKSQDIVKRKFERGLIVEKLVKIYEELMYAR